MGHDPGSAEGGKGAGRVGRLGGLIRSGPGGIPGFSLPPRSVVPSIILGRRSGLAVGGHGR